MSTTTEPPPQFKPNVVELVSTTHSKISRVTLYPGRAEVTRTFSLSLKQGVNQVKISALPTVLEPSSLRIEGRGAATIYDVTVSLAPTQSEPTTSEALDSLLQEQKRVEQAVARCKAAATSLEKYFHSLDPSKVNVADLGSHMEAYEQENKKIDERLLSLGNRLEELRVQIEDERARLDLTSYGVSELNHNVIIVVFAESGGEAEVTLTYAVSQANWKARYDIRAVLQSREITLIYKASICQATGETWENIPLTLETVTPTSNVVLPLLRACRLKLVESFTTPPPPQRIISPSDSSRRSSRSRSHSRLRGRLHSRSRSRSRSPESRTRRHSPTRRVAMNYVTIPVSNFGGFSAMYDVPGLINIPSDGQNHNVTIAELKFDASFFWMTIPRVDTRVHLRAQVKNDSQYTLLAGEAHVYVDGSFTSQLHLPAVVPYESFDCPLGLDPAVRVTYHPLSQKASLSGFYTTKISTKSYTQRISVFNTKTTAIDSLKIVDRIPVSKDSQISVKLISPTLSLPSSGPSGDSVMKKLRASKAPETSLRVGDGVIAQWDRAADPATDLSALGRDGKLNWVCVVPPQGKLNLSLQWEETSPEHAQVTTTLD